METIKIKTLGNLRFLKDDGLEMNSAHEFAELLPKKICKIFYLCFDGIRKVKVEQDENTELVLEFFKSDKLNQDTIELDGTIELDIIREEFLPKSFPRFNCL